jgi:hypothetical protein
LIASTICSSATLSAPVLLPLFVLCLRPHRAVKLVPDCAELAHFHFVLLYDAASDSCAYEDDIAGCERGLGIERTAAALL